MTRFRLASVGASNDVFCIDVAGAGSLQATSASKAVVASVRSEFNISVAFERLAKLYLGPEIIVSPAVVLELNKR